MAKKVPQINASSMADISFLLLIFFLVTTSMDVNQGLARRLPAPIPPDQKVEDKDINKRNLLVVKINSANQLMVQGQEMSVKQLREKAKEFIANVNDDANLPEKSEREVNLLGRCRVSDRHVITIEADRATTYEAYFNMQNAIVKGYNKLRNDLALRRFGHEYARCSDMEREAIKMVYPQRISESLQEKGGRQ